jgi:glutathione S-transferase
MKLFLNKASPYARLVLVVAHEKGIAERIELVWTDPWKSEDRLLAVTPVSKVPVLIAQDGDPLVESSCICEYLDGLGAGDALMPKSGAPRITALRKYGLGRALIDVSFGCVIEQRYGAGDDAVLARRWRAAVGRTISVIEKYIGHSDAPDLGDLTAAVALSYIDFRMSDVNWRTSAPRLASWLDRIAARRSLAATAPEQDSSFCREPGSCEPSVLLNSSASAKR